MSVIKKKVAFHTLGCKLNFAETSTISRSFPEDKFERVPSNSKADIYVINRENVVWLVKLYGKKWPFDMVVIDELSSFKSPKSKRFKALRKVRPKRIVGLTGTPAPNSLIDLWSQIYLLDQGERLGKTISSYPLSSYWLDVGKHEDFEKAQYDIKQIKF